MKPLTQIFLSSKRSVWLNQEYSQVQHSVTVSSKEAKKNNSFIDWSEISLKPSFDLSFIAKEDCAVILLPLVGKIKVGLKSLLEVGESQIQFLRKSKKLLISNPYKEEVNHFLRIVIPYSESFQTYKTSFSLEDSNNSINSLFEIQNQNSNQNSISFKLGCFDGRQETTLNLNGDLFAYSLNGAFEVQNCLLEQADGLKIVDTKVVEMEALSNQAVLALLEY